MEVVQSRNLNFFLNRIAAICAVYFDLRLVMQHGRPFRIFRREQLLPIIRHVRFYRPQTLKFAPSCSFRTRSMSIPVSIRVVEPIG